MDSGTNFDSTEKGRMANKFDQSTNIKKLLEIYLKCSFPVLFIKIFSIAVTNAILHFQKFSTH